MSSTEQKIKQVPLLDLTAQYTGIRTEVMEAITRVCDSQQFILGPEVRQLEQEVAEYSDAADGVGVSSGTDALLISLMAAGVGPGDEVITTPYTFFATVGTIVRLGARPVFVDIDPLTYNMRPDQVADRVTSRTKAIIPVHLYGRVVEMAPIMEVAEAHGLVVVEDAAQAIGASDRDGRKAGSIGHYGCFSFFPSKNLGAFGDGGMVTTPDEATAERLRILRVHGSNPKYYHSVVGGNFRLDALQAAVLRVKLRYLRNWTEQRRTNAERYRALFQAADLTEQIHLPKDEPGHIYNQFVIRTKERDRLRAFLRDRGIGTAIYYPLPLHLQECFREFGYQEGDFPEAEAAARETLALPIYPELTREQQEYVVQVLAEFLN